MNRRSFLTAVLATCTAPAIVRASSLMPMVARQQWIGVDMGGPDIGVGGVWPRYIFKACVEDISGDVLTLSEYAGLRTLVNANVYKDMAPIINAALARMPNGGTAQSEHAFF